MATRLSGGQYHELVQRGGMGTSMFGMSCVSVKRGWGGGKRVHEHMNTV